MGVSWGLGWGNAYLGATRGLIRQNTSLWVKGYGEGPFLTLLFLEIK